MILIWIIKFWHSLSEKHFEKCTLEHIAYILTNIKIQYIGGEKIAQQCREFVDLAEDHTHIKKVNNISKIKFFKNSMSRKQA